MTPFASVAMLEKLALLKIALCRAPAFSSASSACLRTAAPPAGPATVRLVLDGFFSLAMAFSRVTDVVHRDCGVDQYDPCVDGLRFGIARCVRGRTAARGA